MVRRIIAAGTLGGLALMVWSAFINIVFGFAARTQMTPVPNERAVYDLLAGLHMAPGAYLANPALVNGQFPDGAPVFGIHYAGFGHEAAGILGGYELLLAILSGVLAAWMVALSSPRVQAQYLHRALYVTMLGVFAVVVGVLPKYGIGGLPWDLVVLLTANAVVGWVLCALVIAAMLHAPRTDTILPASDS